MSLTNQQIELIQATVPVLKEHGAELTAYFYNRMLTNNPELKETFNMGHQRSGAQARSLAGAVLAYAENITSLENLGDAVSLIAHKHVSLNIQPEQYDIVGDNLLHSISEVLNVPMDADLIHAWAAAYQQLATILIDVERDLYGKQAQAENGWTGWKPFKIVKKEAESSEITSFYLAPMDGHALPAYRPGQYISVRVNVPELGLHQPRQYTLSDHSNGQYFRISVKKEAGHDGLADGYVSNTLHQQYQVGDIVEVSNPTGDFVLLNPNKDNVFISAGVGLTPMVAMLNELLAQQSKHQISFIHACRNSQVLAMHNHIQTIAAQHPNIHTYLACETEDPQLPADRIGRLDLTALDADLLPREADYYVCGPKPFMLAQCQSLRHLGIPAQNIHMELFNTGGVADIKQAEAA